MNMKKILRKRINIKIKINMKYVKNLFRIRNFDVV